MKRILYLCSALLLIGSFGLTEGRSFAARQSATMKTVRICTSTPIGVPALKVLSQGVRNGVALAVRNFRPKFKAAGLNLGPILNMDYAKSDGSGYSTDQERQNALNCLSQPNTLAYIGTLNSGAALVSEPILNKQAMVQISFANTSPDLTNPKLRKSQEPATYRHLLKYVTYYRTVTTDNLQGPAGAAFMKNNLGVKKVFVVDDKLAYGAGLALKMKQYAIKTGMQAVGAGHIDPSDAATIASSSAAIADSVRSTKPDAVYCGCDSETAISFVRDLRNRGYSGPFVGGDALYNQAWITSSGSASANNYATSVGPDQAKTSGNFRKLYRQAFPNFGTPRGYPEAYDAPAYDAASIALKAILMAKKGGKLVGGKYAMRKAILPYVATIKWFGATGVTTFDRNGDTTNRKISIYGVQGSTWKFRAQAPIIKGIVPA